MTLLRRLPALGGMLGWCVVALLAVGLSSTGHSPRPGAGGPVTVDPRLAASSTGSFVTYRVYTTRYEPVTPGSAEAAVPDQCAKFAALRSQANLDRLRCPAGYTLGLDYRVLVTRDNGATAVVPVKEVGPWNLDDNYWARPGSTRPRRLFGVLPEGTPEAQAAFLNGFNRVADCKALDKVTFTGRPGPADQFGRCVLNPAGLDLSSAVFSALGINTGGEYVTVTFLWEPASAASKPAVQRADRWYLRQSATTGGAHYSFGYGVPGDVGLMGDWDGNGSKTAGVFRGGAWYLRNSNRPGGGEIAFGFGDPGDVPLVGDWNGDGIDTVGVFRRGFWYLTNNPAAGADTVFHYGNPTDTPLVGDWNGNRADTVGVFRSGAWYLTNNPAAGADTVFGYGDPGDIPLVGDWNGNVFDTVGVFRSGVWYITNNVNSGRAEATFGYGDPNDRPLVWR